MPDPCTLAEERAKRFLRKYVRAMKRNAPAAAAQDPDAIHDLRVASRRTRATLAEFHQSFGPQSWRSVKKRVRNITRHLGNARELDVNLELLDTVSSDTDAAVIAFIRDRLEAHRGETVEDVHRAAQAVLSTDFDELVDSLLNDYRPTETCMLEWAETCLKRRLRKAKKAYARYRKRHAEEDLHALRVRFKKLRYATEIHGDLYGPLGKQLRRNFKTVQDELGVWNDYRVFALYVETISENAEDLRHTFAQLTRGLTAIIDERRSRIDRKLQTFFDKPRLFEYKKTFARPQSACCRDPRASTRQTP